MQTTQDLRMLSNSLKQEILKIRNFHMEELNDLGTFDSPTVC